MNSSRFLFYFLICFLVSVVDVLRDLNEEDFFEAIEHVPLIFLVTFVLTTSVYYLRLWLLKKSSLKTFAYKESKNKWILYSVIIIIKAIVFTFIIRSLAQIFQPDYTSYSLSGLFFWASFTAILCVILFVYVIEAFLESESEKKEFIIKLSEIENERMIAKYQALKNQLNPHFLFNSFNSLSALIELDSKKAESFLQGLSDVYRYNLDHSEDIVITLEKELELIKVYMQLQQIIFNNSLQITYNIDVDKLGYLLPPMTLELLVENAIKHNVVEKTSPLKIEISSKDNYVVVENNYQRRGDSISNTDSLGIGLKNLKNQYELIHDEKPTFKIEDGKYQAIIPLIKPSI